MVSTVVSIILTVITSLMGFIAYKYPFEDENHQRTKIANLFLVLTVLAVSGGSYLIYNTAKENKDNNTAQNSLKDSVGRISWRLDIQTGQLRSLGYTTDFVKGRLVKIDSQLNENRKVANVKTEEEMPMLDVVSRDGNINPFVKSLDKPLHYAFEITTESIENYIVLYPRATLYAVYIKNNQIEKYYPNKVSLNKSVKMQKTEWYFSDYQFHFNSELKDSILFYWKVAFNNKNNKRQPSLRKMYFFTMDKVNKQLEEPDDDIYDYFKRKLVDKKIW